MFKTIAMMKSGALALFLASTVVGAAEAQPPDLKLSGHCTGALFTLPEGSTTRFHVVLDDNSSEPSIVVLMRFINQTGTVVKTRTVTIGPGGSATLEFRGSGLYRVQAETFESTHNTNVSDRRTVVTSQESEVPVFEGGILMGFRPVLPGPLMIPCSAYKLQ